MHGQCLSHFHGSYNIDEFCEKWKGIYIGSHYLVVNFVVKAKLFYLRIT